MGLTTVEEQFIITLIIETVERRLNWMPVVSESSGFLTAYETEVSNNLSVIVSNGTYPRDNGKIELSVIYTYQEEKIEFKVPSEYYDLVCILCSSVQYFYKHRFVTDNSYKVLNLMNEYISKDNTEKGETDE